MRSVHVNAVVRGSCVSSTAWQGAAALRSHARRRRRRRRRRRAAARAALHKTTTLTHKTLHNKHQKNSISVTFVDKDGAEQVVAAPLGKSMLEVAHDNEIDLEGACEGSLACSTCHVIVEDGAYYAKLPEPTEDELDMLDLAYGLTETCVVQWCCLVCV